MKLHTALTLLILGITAQAGWADPISFTYTYIDVPGSGVTAATGINNAGQVVGDYADSTGSTHGFLDTNGTFTTLDFPGSTYTVPTGINNVGQIVGFYSGGAFLYQNGTYTNLNLPVSPVYSVINQLGINDLGQIVGTNRNGYPRAFLYTNGQVTYPFPPLMAAPTADFAYGINNAGAIVVEIAPTCCELAYVYANGQYTGVGDDTETAYGINNAGDVLVYDSNVSSTCLVSLTGQPVRLTTKGCLPPYDPHDPFDAGIGRGLNDLDQIVGVTPTGGHSFVATPVPEPVSVLLLASGLAGVSLLLRRKRINQ